MQWNRTLVKPVQCMVQRWLQNPANNEFDVVHRLGRNHGNADALSRAPHLIEDPTLELDISMGEKIGPMVCSLQSEEAWTMELVREGQEQDEELSEVRKWVLDKTTSLQQSALTAEGKKLAGLFDSLYLDKDQVLRYDFTYGQEMGLPEVRHLIVLPESVHRGAIERAHHTVAHKAVDATVAKLHKTVYFSGMYCWVNETLQRCETCQVKKGSIPKQRGLLVNHVTGYPFQKISKDFVGPLPRLKNGNQYMLTVSDCFTRWLEAFPCCRANAQVVVNKLVTEIFPRFKVCDQIHSDQGSQFLSDLVTEVVAMHGIRQSSMPSYNPKSNPVERQHRSLGDAIKALTEGDQIAWEDCLPHALFAMCTSNCVSTGVVPFAAMFGRNASASLEMVFGAHPTLPGDVADICMNTLPTCATGWQKRTLMYARTCAAQ
jgi:hypothetical protein